MELQQTTKSPQASLMAALIERNAAFREVDAAKREAAQNRRAAILAIRHSAEWDREIVARAIGVQPRALDRLVREARAGETEERR